MLSAARGLVLALGAFAASFALHIVGGATDQGWLFAIAVGLIFLSAACFPSLALLLGQLRMASPGGRFTAIAGGMAGVVLLSIAFWAANGRTWAWWHVPLAAVVVVSVNLAVVGTARLSRKAALGRPARSRLGP